MATSDVRDILDVRQDGTPRPAKKQKAVQRRPGRQTVVQIYSSILIQRR